MAFPAEAGELYPVQSASALVIHERGHVSAGEILRFSLWMTALAYAVILVVAPPYWGLVGQPLTRTAAAGTAASP